MKRTRDSQHSNTKVDDTWKTTVLIQSASKSCDEKRKSGEKGRKMRQNKHQCQYITFDMAWCTKGCVHCENVSSRLSEQLVGRRATRFQELNYEGKIKNYMSYKHEIERERSQKNHKNSSQSLRIQVMSLYKDLDFITL